MHPFDLATNKTLALIGRAEVRDWVDIIHCHAALQPFGCLVWATCGKDPGLSPAFILDQASRSSHYTAEDYRTLAFEGRAPDARVLSRTWRAMLAEGEAMIALLPEDHVGRCVMTRDGNLFKGSLHSLEEALEANTLAFHAGSVRGAWPQLAS